jgi:hypothetical protein
MTAPRSAYPWDVVVTRRAGQLWLDKRPGSAIDRLTVRGWGQRERMEMHRVERKEGP